MKAHTRSARHEALAQFLTTRRTRLLPETCGLASVHARRRTPGLRREDVSAIAGISSAYYTWIEQGREFDISVEVLSAIAGALRLSATEIAHLFTLAGRANPALPEFHGIPGSLTTIGLRNDIPACRLTPWLDVVEATTAARDLLDIDRGTNLAAWLFAPVARSVSVNGSATMATLLVALLRRNHGRDPENRCFDDVTTPLRASSVPFRTLWDAHVVDFPELDDVEVEHGRHGRRTYRGTLFCDPVGARWFVIVLAPVGQADIG